MATTCSVRVIDKDTRQPVQRALVMVFPGNPFGGKVRGITDADGRVTFYEGPPILNIKTFDFTIIAVGYYPDGLSGEFSTESREFEVALEPVEVLRQPAEETVQQGFTIQPVTGVGGAYRGE